MDTVLVTGANRGIGLKVVELLLAEGQRVIATCRQPGRADALDALAVEDRLIVRELDVSDAGSVERLVMSLDDQAIDVLFNNAGVMRRESGVADLDYDEWAHTLLVNTIAPVRLANALHRNLSASTRARVVTVSSQMGSIERCGTGAIAYRSSKSAINMAMASIAKEWASEGIIVCTVHPGWVRTDMGGQDATLSVSQSASDLVRLIGSLQASDNGRFINHDGDTIPW